MPETDFDGAARLALEDWDLDVAGVRQVSNSENIVFRVDTHDEKIYVLRLHRPGYHSFEELVSEQTWTGALSASGLDVPIPVMTRRDQPYGELEALGQRRFTGVLEWVSGETMRSQMKSHHDLSYATSCFQQLGELLGRVHNQASTWSLPRHFHRHALDAEGLMGERPFWGPFWKAGSLSETQRDRFTAIRRQIFEILSQLPTHPDGFSLIHADLHPGNVVMSDQRLHLIDFDDAGFGWHAYDLAVALKDYQEHPRFEDFQEALILGYQSVRPVHEETLDLIPLFLLIRALASIGWAEARPELDLDDYPARLAAYAEERAGSVLAPFV